MEGQAAQVFWQLQSYDEKKSGISKNVHGILHNFEVQVAYPFVSHRVMRFKSTSIKNKGYPSSASLYIIL